MFVVGRDGHRHRPTGFLARSPVAAGAFLPSRGATPAGSRHHWCPLAGPSLPSRGRGSLVSVAFGPQCGLGTVRDTDPLERRRQMRLEGALADPEAARDLLVREPLSD